MRNPRPGVSSDLPRTQLPLAEKARTQMLLLNSAVSFPVSFCSWKPVFHVLQLEISASFDYSVTAVKGNSAQLDSWRTFISLFLARVKKINYWFPVWHHMAMKEEILKMVFKRRPHQTLTFLLLRFL